MGMLRRFVVFPIRVVSLLGIPRAVFLCSGFLLIWALGAAGFLLSEWETLFVPGEWLPALYHSLQMFGLNFDLKEGFPVHPLLQTARFAAPIFVSSSVIWALSQPVRDFIRIRWQRLQADQRIIVIGYGAVGQAVARRYTEKNNAAAWNVVTAVERDPDQGRRIQAKADRVLLIAGDGSTWKTLNTICLHRASRVYLALSDDMATLDAANAARLFLSRQSDSPAERRDTIRALLRDDDLDRRIVDGTASGAGLRKWISCFSMPQMAAEELCRVARFDRIALDARQSRAHLVIFGCGQQGDAIAMEALLTVWRNDLAPPMITVFDKSSAAIEARWRQMAPALFLQPGRDEGALPEGSKPDIRFRDFELDAGKPWPDFSRDAPVTAYILATGDDTVNLKAALSLETAMMRRRIDAAPIHTRLWNGHRGDTADPGFGPLSLIQPFGSLESIVATGAAFEDDPDSMAKAMHARYLETGSAMRAENPNFPFVDSEWSDLPETLRIANRRLSRHWAQKLEDLGFQWRPLRTALPRLDAQWALRFAEVEKAVDHAKLTVSTQPENWSRHEALPPELAAHASLAGSLRRGAITEHDRWMADRVLEGWRATARRDKSLRDNDRRLHHNIWHWDELDAVTRRWDTVFLRALVEGAAKDGGATGTMAHVKHVVAVTLGLRNAGAAETAYCWDIVADDQDGKLATELAVSIAPLVRLTDIVVVPDCAAASPLDAAVDAKGAVALAKAAFGRFLAAMDHGGNPCRVRFVFDAPPSDQTLDVAQALADAATERGIEVSAAWAWKAAPQARQHR